jgi:hypothetical protein
LLVECSSSLLDLLDLGGTSGGGLGVGLGGLGGSSLLGAVGLVGEDGLAANNGGIGVELDHDTPVLERVALVQADLALLDDGAESALDLLGVDDAGDVGVGELAVRQRVAELLGALGVEGAKDLVESLEGRLGPDDEAAEVTTGRELEEVEARDVGGLDAGQVAEAQGSRLLVVDHERTTARHVASVAALALTGADAARVLGGLDVVVGTEGLEESDGGLGLLEVVEGGIGNDEWHLGDVLDLVATCDNQWSERSGGKSRSNCEALLVDVDPSVPSAPGLGGCEHTTTAAHVAERSLAGTVRTTTGNTWNTRHGATSTPRHGTGLVTGLYVDSIGLASVLREVGMDELDHIQTNGRREDCWRWDLSGDVALVAVENPDKGSDSCLGLRATHTQTETEMQTQPQTKIGFTKLLLVLVVVVRVARSCVL